MTLYEICPLAKEKGISDTEINSVTDNTNKFQKGDVFVCIKGNSFDGHTAAAEMEKKGASLIVAERDTGCKRQLLVQNTREYYSYLAANYFGNPQKKLKMIAVTGTNGKTTITHIIQHILNTLGKKCACIGTAGCDLCGKFYESDGDIPTTPLQMELFKYLSEAAENGAEYCAIETSSQALVQGRLYGIDYEIGIFTNLTQDHLDVHGTMENYYKAKKSLFKNCARALICVDDKYGKRLMKELDMPNENKRDYSITDAANYYSINTKITPAYVSYWFSSDRDDKSFPVKFGMPGMFNIANSAAALGACRELGFDMRKCVAALENFKGVKGRCEVLYDNDFTVICDYAHTADALEKILSSIKAFAQGKVICVFGAAGERDAEKRPDMGIAVGKNSNLAIVTSDNPRFEDPMEIIRQVETGLNKTMVVYTAIEDRYEAIRYALKQARSKDVVVLCGKGHETHQIYGADYLHFDEHEIVKEILAEQEKTIRDS